MDFCLLCHTELNKDDPTLWKQVIGWVGGPRKDSMRLREDTGHLAHDACVAKLQSGQAIDQQSLLEAEAGEGELDDERHFISDDEIPI